MGVSGCGRQEKMRLRSTLNHGQTRDLDSVCNNKKRYRHTPIEIIFLLD